MRFPVKKNAGRAQKHPAIYRQEEIALSSPRRVALGLLSPFPRVCTDGWRTYTDVRAKISWIERLPDLLINGDPLCGRRPQRSAAKNPDLLDLSFLHVPVHVIPVGNHRYDLHIRDKVKVPPAR